MRARERVSQYEVWFERATPAGLMKVESNMQGNNKNMHVHMLRRTSSCTLARKKRELERTRTHVHLTILYIQYRLLHK